MLPTLSPKGKSWTTETRTSKNYKAGLTLFDHWRCFMHQHNGAGECGWRNDGIHLHLSTLMPMINAVGVAIIMYNIRAELSKREYMAVNKYANKSNARAISDPCRHPSTH